MLNAQDFSAKLVAGLDFTNAGTIKTSMQTAVVAVLEEVRNRDARITALEKELVEVKRPKPAEPKTTRAFKGTPFTGERDSLEVAEFLQQVRLFVTMNNYDEVQHQRVLLSGLRGTAHKAVTTWMQDPAHAGASHQEIGKFL